MAERSGIMLCYPLDEKRLLKWGVPVIVQPKLDGIRCRYLSNDHILLSSEQNEITMVPHILKALEPLRGTGIELDGELYNHSLTFEQIVGITSRSVNQHSCSSDLEYHIFDIVDEHSPQHIRLLDLKMLFAERELRLPLVHVDFNVVVGLNDVMKLLRLHCDAGYEGIIVRHPTSAYARKRSTSIMKFKPRKIDTYLIIGSEEEISIKGEPKNRLGALICDSGDGTTFKVGSGFTDHQRKRLWDIRESLPGRFVTVLYQHLTSKHVPRFPVFKCFLSESC